MADDLAHRHASRLVERTSHFTVVRKDRIEHVSYSGTSSRLSPHILPGYASPFLWLVVAILLVSALYLSKYVLHHHITISYAVTIIAVVTCVAVHEGLRGCAASATDVFVLAIWVVVSAAQALIVHAQLFKAVTTHHGHTILWLHHAQRFRRNADCSDASRAGSRAKKRQYARELHTQRARPPVASVQDDDQQAAPSVVILYLHGGGYLSMSPRVYIDLCSRLIHCVRDQLMKQQIPLKAYKLQALITSYRKLPKVVYPTPVDDCMVMYEYLTSQTNVLPSNIILAGDSAGASLVLSVLLRLRDAGQEIPLGAICSCPFVDFASDEPLASHCSMSTAVPTVLRDFCKIAHPTDSDAWREAHIVDRDLSKLPPLLIQTGSFDIFHQHALRLAKKAAADGVLGLELDVHHGMPHVFPTFPGWLLPGSERGVELMAVFIVKRLQETSGSVRKQQAGVDESAHPF